MGRCATCEHFSAHKEHEYMGYAEDFDEAAMVNRVRAGTPLEGDCPALPAYFDGYCLAAEMPDKPEQGAKMLASSIDGSNYRGSLLVKADFGCVLWSPQTPEQT